MENKINDADNQQNKNTKKYRKSQHLNLIIAPKISPAKTKQNLNAFQRGQPAAGKLILDLC